MKGTISKMAKGTMRSQYAKLAQKIKVKSDKIQEFVDKVPREIANEGLDIAKQKLTVAISNPFFTQKHEYALVDEIGLRQSTPRRKTNIKQGNAYTLYAPVSGDRDIAYEMYFAEYGAGIGAASAKFKPTTFAKLHYIPTKVLANGYWYYRLINPIIKKDKSGRNRQKNYNYVNTSIPVNYMWAARIRMSFLLNQQKENLINELGVKITTNIAHPKK